MNRNDPSQDSAETIGTLIAKGDAARDAGHWDDAVTAYGEVVELAPDMFGYWVQLGHALKGVGRLDDAESAYRRAAAGEPEIADTHVQLGHLLKMSGRRDAARLAYEHAAVLDPDSGDARHELAVMRLEDSNELRTSFDAFVAIGDASRDAGNWQAAVSAYEQVVTIAPDMFGYVVQLGHALRASGRLDEAIATYRRAADGDRKNANPHLELGRVLEQSGRIEEAIAAFERALALNPGLDAARSRIEALRPASTSDQPRPATVEVAALEPATPVTRGGALAPPRPALSGAPAPRPADAQAFDDLVALGDAARDGGIWPEAIHAYQRALALRPDMSRYEIQLGHALKATGQLAEAEAAYRRAIERAGDDADGHLQLGHLLKLAGRRNEAIAAFGEALRIDPDQISARRELIALGERSRTGRSDLHRAGFGSEISRAVRDAQSGASAIAEWVQLSAYPTGAYDDFRAAFPVRPPPGEAIKGDAAFVGVLIDDAGEPSRLRDTLLSLIDQSHQQWRCWVVDPGGLGGHPVGSLARIDPRIAFIPDATIHDVMRADLTDEATCIVSLSEGTLLHPEALAWFAFVMRDWSPAAAMCDEDVVTELEESGPFHGDPLFQDIVDVDHLVETRRGPACLCVGIDLATRLADLMTASDMAFDGDARRRLVTLLAADRGAVAHVPRVLASVLSGREDKTVLTREIAARLLPDLSPDFAHRLEPGRSDRRLAVVIPTRDQAAMLQACVESLIAKAADPDTIDIVIVDNRSSDPALLDLLDSYADRGIARIIAMDEPFNWSRANNLAAEATGESDLLFMNNDMEMLTQNWDLELRTLLARDDVGAIGAKLLYPDGTIQHAGIILGLGLTGPLHDGLTASDEAAGPNDRWSVTRGASAVTGAFLAVRRIAYEQAGGFNEHLSVAYNDVDFCFRLREQDLTVIYTPRIRVTHYESATRQTGECADPAWDRSELRTLVRTWGAQARSDPSYSPHWALRGRPFDGYREPSNSEILKRIELTATTRPWRILRP